MDRDPNPEAMLNHRRAIALWASLFLCVLIWSGYHPKDTWTWFLETLPAMAGALILASTLKRYPLTPLSYQLILIHAIILMIGGHYTYAEVPLFDLLKEALGQDRNNYDKVGHFAQGFIPAIVCREVVIRNGVFTSGAWQTFFILCFCLALSAFYELIEWWVALAAGLSAEAFLGTQGYMWDTQSDMLLALIGALSGLAFLHHRHDRQLGQFTWPANRR